MIRRGACTKISQRWNRHRQNKLTKNFQIFQPMVSKGQLLLTIKKQEKFTKYTTDNTTERPVILINRKKEGIFLHEDHFRIPTRPLSGHVNKGLIHLVKQSMYVLNGLTLKGQCHEIFDFWFFSWINFPHAPEYTITAISNFSENLLKYSRLKVHHRWKRWYRWCTLTCEYLLKFLTKFETVLMGYFGAGGKLTHEKNQKQKISWHCPFKRTL